MGWAALPHSPDQQSNQSPTRVGEDVGWRGTVGSPQKGASAMCVTEWSAALANCGHNGITPHFTHQSVLERDLTRGSGHPARRAARRSPAARGLTALPAGGQRARRPEGQGAMAGPADPDPSYSLRLRLVGPAADQSRLRRHPLDPGGRLRPLGIHTVPAGRTRHRPGTSARSGELPRDLQSARSA